MVMCIIMNVGMQFVYSNYKLDFNSLKQTYLRIIRIKIELLFIDFSTT